MRNIYFILALLFSIYSCSTSEVNNEIQSSEKQNIKTQESDSTELNTEPNLVDENKSHDSIIQSVIVQKIDLENPEEIVFGNQDPEEIIVDFHEYEFYTAFLKKYVSNKGNVNYISIKSNVSSLNTIIQSLEDNYPESNWTKNQRLAYWINAYNIYTIQLIVDNYPTSSIKDITAKPWDKKFIKLGGNTYSLNNIENSIIRIEFNEPRIHFALNCASISCPILMNSAFKASSLKYQLTKQTKNFLADGTKNTFTGAEIKLSPVFDWYKEDFIKNGSLIDFINKYRSEQLVNPTVNYNEYDWGLNN